MSARRKMLAVLSTGLVSLLSAEARAQVLVDTAPRARSGFWVDAGLGYGSLGYSGIDSRSSGPTANLAFGFTPREQLRLGLAYSAFIAAGGDRSDLLGTFGLQARYYPVVKSPIYLIGSVGVSSLGFSESNEFLTTDSGISASVGVGTDLRLSDVISVSPSLSYQRVRLEFFRLGLWHAGIGITLGR